MSEGGFTRQRFQSSYMALSICAGPRSAAVLLGGASGLIVYASAFTSLLPVAGLAFPIVAFALCTERRKRFIVALAVQLALWSHIPPALMAYGVDPVFAFIAVALGIMMHAGLLGLLPPWASLPLWACSPCAFGHPWLGIFSMLPVGHAPWAAIAALSLCCLAGYRRTVLVGGVALGLFLSAINFVSEDVRPNAGVTEGKTGLSLLGVDTVILGQALVAVTEWEIAREAVAVALSASQGSPSAILLPEAVISRDPARADSFFKGLAERVGADLFVGVDRSGKQVIRHFPASAFGAHRDVYTQVQGVPFLTGTGVAAPYRHFEYEPWIAPDGTSVRFMICYELFLPLPWLAARLGSGKVAIAASDGWGMPVPLAFARTKLTSAFGDRNFIVTAISNTRDRNGN